MEAFDPVSAGAEVATGAGETAPNDASETTMIAEIRLFIPLQYRQSANKICTLHLFLFWHDTLDDAEFAKEQIILTADSSNLVLNCRS